jgi:hypothetical protein
MSLERVIAAFAGLGWKALKGISLFFLFGGQ